MSYKHKKLPFLCLAFFLLTVGIVMLLNIYIYQAQYRVVGLTNKKNHLESQTKMLNEHTDKIQSPKNLSKKAKNMGMSENVKIIFIDLHNKKLISDTDYGSTKSIINNSNIISQSENLRKRY